MISAVATCANTPAAREILEHYRPGLVFPCGPVVKAWIAEPDVPNVRLLFDRIGSIEISGVEVDFEAEERKANERTYNDAEGKHRGR